MGGGESKDKIRGERRSCRVGDCVFFFSAGVEGESRSMVSMGGVEAAVEEEEVDEPAVGRFMGPADEDV